MSDFQGVESAASAAGRATGNAITFLFKRSGDTTTVEVKISKIGGIALAGALGLAALFSSEGIVRQIKNPFHRIFIRDGENNNGIAGGEVADIRPRSFLVKLQFFTSSCFLKFMADFEEGTIMQRFIDEFLAIGIQMEDFAIEIENRERVAEEKERAIRKEETAAQIRIAIIGTVLDDKTNCNDVGEFENGVLRFQRQSLTDDELLQALDDFESGKIEKTLREELLKMEIHEEIKIEVEDIKELLERKQVVNSLGEADTKVKDENQKTFKVCERVENSDWKDKPDFKNFVGSGAPSAKIGSMSEVSPEVMEQDRGTAPEQHTTSEACPDALKEDPGNEKGATGEGMNGKGKI